MLPDPRMLITFRYLRMALIAVLVLLVTAVVVQTIHGRPPEDPYFLGEHWQTSISYYYWTPVRSVFVGALMAMGVTMVILKADNELEDGLLNIAGLLAPLVALVPTTLHSAVSAKGCKDSRFPAEVCDGIANNVLALVVALLVAATIFLVVAHHQPPAAGNAPDHIKAFRARMFAATAAIFIVFGVLFFAQRRWFDGHAHICAAVGLFVCIIAVTVLNARTKYLGIKAGIAHARTYFRWYGGITVAMGIGVATAIVMYFSDYTYTPLFIEAWVLGFFLVFWIVQSKEQWHQLRAPDPANLTILPTAG